jgi:hypothetical protein
VHQYRTVGQQRPALRVHDGNMGDGQHGNRRRPTASGSEAEQREKGTNSGDHVLSSLSRRRAQPPNGWRLSGDRRKYFSAIRAHNMVGSHLVIGRG